jgi:predicted RNA-binding Zn ribbon-like protein
MIPAEPDTRPLPFELIAGNLSLDFVNTLDDRPSGKPNELLKGFDDLARFASETGILTPAQADYLLEKLPPRSAEPEDALGQARNLRETLYAIFSAVVKGQKAPPIALDKLNASVHEAALHSRLVQNGERCEWRFDDPGSSFSSILWPIARAAADLLASDQLPFVHACSSPTCQWFFLDTSKNHHRRWCSMKLCGNRTKVRKFYARKKTGPSKKMSASALLKRL